MQTGIEDIRDIKDPLAGMDSMLALWVGIAVVVLFLLLLVVLFLARQPKRAPIAPYYRRVLEQLERIQLEMADVSDEQFSVEISSILRGFLERTLLIKSTHQSTQEFLKAASRHSRMQGHSMDSLQAFLELCDLAKFATEPLTWEQREELFNYAYSFIEDVQKAMQVPFERIRK